MVLRVFSEDEGHLEARFLSHTEELDHQEVKSKRVLKLFTAQLLGKYYLDQIFSESKFKTTITRSHMNRKRHKFSLVVQWVLAKKMFAFKCQFLRR